VVVEFRFAATGKFAEPASVAIPCPTGRKAVFAVSGIENIKEPVPKVVVDPTVN
jgi:hypothetical protein